MKKRSHPSSHNDSKTNQIAQEVYRDVISSLCIEIASGVHRMAKTGKIPLSQIYAPVSTEKKRPRDHDGEIKEDKNKNEEEIQGLKDLRKDASVTDPEGMDAKKETVESESQLKKPRLEESNESIDDPSLPPTPPTASAPHQSLTNSQSNSNSSSNNSNHGASKQKVVDLWGRAPPKHVEKQVLCHKCGKKLHVTRFALHLDRCLGFTSGRSR